MSSPTPFPSRSRRRWRYRLLASLVLTACVGAGLWGLWRQLPQPAKTATVVPSPSAAPAAGSDGGRIVSRTPTTTYTPAEVEAASRQDYGSYTPAPKYGVARTEIQYQSYETDGTPIMIYARVYLPVGRTGAPILGFAPGTTGIGDECAPSLEEPAKANWANYESHMQTYAGQGYAAVITDYEGMRDADRIHHYMVGEMEGRAVLDSVRALINLEAGTQVLDTADVFLAGYSQGGHAAFWADQIAPSYAPALSIKGVIGWGPVMDVQETLADILHAANINWFGPYVLTSYADYYHDDYDPAGILLPRWNAHLRSDVLAHCIDTDLGYWGHDPHAVYTPEFLTALASGLNDAKYSLLKQRLTANQAGSAHTASAKLINEGEHDNVVLPMQQTAAMKRVCAASQGPAELKVWPGATHYTAMEVSLSQTLAWMNDVAAGRPVPRTCP